MSQRDLVYWKANKRLIFILLAIWAFVSLGCGILFVEPLNRFNIGGTPFGFWMAQQGSIYVFVILIFFYAWRMDQLDKAHHIEGGSSAPHPTDHHTSPADSDTMDGAQ